MSVLLVGNDGGTNVGGSLLRGGADLGLDVRLVRARAAMQAPAVLRHFNWRFRGRRPTRLHGFGQDVVRLAASIRPRALVATGQAPLSRQALEEIGTMGIRRIAFLTDDPWNPAHRAPWFLDALAAYDIVFSPRRANLDSLRAVVGPAVAYLPFAYDPALFYPDAPSGADRGRFASDVVFAGGADPDRVPYMEALVQSGLRLALYGDYWGRFRHLRSASRGYATPDILRKAVGAAKVALCMVRRANRDGHSMRSFEVPAIGACMLVEETEEHLELFGAEGSAVLYFRQHGEMLDKARWLLARDSVRDRLARAAHRLIVEGRNTYRDRLETMLAAA